MNKTILIILGGVLVSPFLSWIEKYIFNDWEFLIFLTTAVSIDTVLGLIKSWKRGNISSKGCGGIIYKMISYSAILVILHIMSNFTIDKNSFTVFSYVKVLGYSSLIVKEAISIVENIACINNTFLPKWILKKLQQFDDKGEINIKLK